MSNSLLPGISIDCVVFGFHENTLKVLLLKLKNTDKWALPGGFVELDTDMDRAAINILRGRTGLDRIFLKQFHFYFIQQRPFQFSVANKVFYSGRQERKNILCISAVACRSK